MNFNKTKSLLVFIITAGLLTLQTTVFADNIQTEARWILVGDSPLLDRSSKYLSNGYTKSGIKYARKALSRSQSAFTEVIAQHNLCIAYTRKAEETLAREHCLRAANAFMPNASLKEIKPGLYKIVRRRKPDSSLLTLNAVITQNLALNEMKRDAVQIAQAD
jgi:hypothetical protein